MIKKDILDFTCEQLHQLFMARGFKESHAGDVFKALYCRGCLDFKTIKSVSKELRQYLTDNFQVSRLPELSRQVSNDGTIKFLFSLPDGQTIECVYIPEPRRRTLCVSSQVGCKLGCTFCVSGKYGFGRNLSAGEMVNQVLTVNDLLDGDPVSNVVFMGSGEPLDNYENLMRTIDILRHFQGLYMAKRKISISTSGIVPRIRQMIYEKQGVPLSVSLHSTRDDIRSRLMPVNLTYPLQMLKEVMLEYSHSEGLPIFLEYIMIKGVNIAEYDALSLVEFVKVMQYKINLIPYNPSPYIDFQSPETREINDFRKILETNHVFYRLRKTRGQDIAAACGQLKNSSQTA